MDPDQPSYWWPCPECGGVHFRTICVFERGQWAEDRDEYLFDDPPNGRPNAIVTGDVECVDCGHRLDIHAHYGWPLIGEFEATT